LDVVLLALACARVTILITRDDIFKPLRNWIFLFSPPENDDRLGYYYQNLHRVPRRLRWRWDEDERKPGFIGEALSCPDCTGVWVGAILVFSYVLYEEQTITFSLVMALAMVASWIARKGKYT